MEFTLEMVAAFLGGELIGDKNLKVNTIAKIEEAGAGALCFLSNMKYEPHIYTTGATAVIVNRDFTPSQPVSAALIKVDDAYGAFAKLLELYIANKPRKSGVSPLASIDPKAEVGEGCYVGEFAVVSPGAKLGKGCRIYPGVYLGDNVRVGDNALLMPGVVVYEECVLGDNVTIHSGTVIGADGFGFAPNASGGYDKIPQIGNVVIEDGVEIGANTCIDRATMGSTVIHKGAKLDNLIQIAHNVTLGENSVFAAQVGIAGSTHVGANCMFGGQVGTVGHITIGDRVNLGSKTGVSNNIADGETHMGYPSQPISKFHRSNAVIRNLPELSSKVNKLEKELAALKDLLSQQGNK